ncbi:MAG TPA: NAD(P)/FAD-dependent oxidoreductase [Dehalococcoidia bacterium]|nr:NAD(P)/FAD-dependent oxidoreductase [Dehalococcoidia bacterium]
MSKYKKKVLILGAGSAGVGAARELKKASAGAPELEVTLVDQQNYHFVLPLIYQVVTGSVAPGHISFPVRTLLRQGGTAGRVKFRQSRVQGIDVERKIVTTDDGELEWDYLVVALGSTTNFFGMDEVEKNALTFRSLRDGINIHNHILDNYEAALLEGDEQPRRELLTFVVVGGGPTGVELAVSIQEFASKVLIRDYPSLTPYVRVILVESQDTVLSGLNAKVGELAITRLRSQGVEVLLRTRISKAWVDGVETADGQVIPTRTVIWVAGVKPAAVVESLPLDKARDGRILVNQNLEVPESPGLYVVGDCAYLAQENGSGPYPATHQVAMRQGPACARNILHAMRGERQRPFRYKFKGQIIYISRNVAVAQILGRAFDGFAAGMLRRILYLEQMLSYLGPLTGFQSKLSTALDWFFAYFYHRDTSRL